MLTKRFVVITIVASGAWFVLTLAARRIGDEFLSQYKFDGAGERAYEIGSFLGSVSEVIVFPLKWFHNLGLPEWLWVSMIPVTFVAWGILTAVVGTYLSRRSSGST